MISLPNNCNCSGIPGNPQKGIPDELSVFPKNWKSSNVSLKQDWYIQYYFRDPLHKDKYPKGKFIPVKGGINHFKTREERQAAVRFLMLDIIKQLKEEGYNPITNKFLPPVVEQEVEYEISPDLPFLEALEKARIRLKCSVNQKINIKSTLKYFSLAAKQLKYDRISIGDIKRKNIRFSLEHCERVKKYWSKSLFNNYRRDLSMLFNELIQTETVEYNPIDKINKLAVAPKLKRTLTRAERDGINNELKVTNYRLWRFIHVFFHSGSRISEIVQLQYENVNLEKQEFKVLIKKGDLLKWESKPIKDVVLPLWKELMDDASKVAGIHRNSFVFAKGLMPADKSIRPEQITRRWKRWVKEKMNIEADFYSLKHLNTDETAAIAGIEIAAATNSHTTTFITEKHYAINEKSRKLDASKKVNNTFN